MNDIIDSQNDFIFWLLFNTHIILALIFSEVSLLMTLLARYDTTK